MEKLKESFTIRDEMHGDITYSPLLRMVIDHPYFQRLRLIKQLGFTEYVFPCANHSRFQHSLGACYLAGQAFDNLLEGWSSFKLTLPKEAEGYLLLQEETSQVIQQVLNSPSSISFWKQALQLAALLHDIGHGPFSHSFESFYFKQDFEAEITKLPHPFRSFLADRWKKNGYFLHEEISLLYLYRILKECAFFENEEESLLFFGIAAYLIHKEFRESKFLLEYLSTLEGQLTQFNIQGGNKFLFLISPVISGPFDVDRIDYIQRDGRNSGVFISGIEWRRLISKVLPCLVRSKKTSQLELVLVSHLKNHPVLEDFLFTLFQMYAQVYLHPKVVGFEETLKQFIEEKKEAAPPLTFDLKTHSELNDQKFLSLLKEKFELPEVELFFSRNENNFDANRFPSSPAIEEKLTKAGYRLVSQKDRPLFKDHIPVLFYSSFNDEGVENVFVNSWFHISKVAEFFHKLEYQPNIWIRNATR